MLMERVTTKEAAKLLNMDVVTLQFLMRQERLPIGYAIKKDGNRFSSPEASFGEDDAGIE